MSPSESGIRNVIVTGGSGFLGSVVCRLLANQGVRHTICDRVGPRETLSALTQDARLDIRNLSELTQAVQGHDAIIHLAAEWNDVGVPDVEYQTTNVEGTRNIAAAAEACNVNTIVFASSSSVYDFEDGRRGAYGEGDSAARPPTLYGQTKRDGERILQEWRDKDPRRVLRIIRPSVIFGPHNRGNVYNLIRQIRSRFFVFPDKRDVVKSTAFVENVAGFFLHLLRSETNEVVFNYCDRPQLTTFELIQRVREIGAARMPLVAVPPAFVLGAASIVDRGPRSLRDRFGTMKVKKLMRATWLSDARALSSGYKQPVDTQAALRATVGWIAGESSKSA
jgi:nucleoside-diphosphate-sugar epimerase